MNADSRFSPMRQCMKADGRRKRQYRKIEDAERDARSINEKLGGNGYRAYCCSFGHIHVGRPPTFQVDEAS